MRYILVDTDILINFLRGKEKTKVFLARAAEESLLCCSAITVAEIFAGMREHEREKTVDLVNGLEVVDVTREIAEKAGAYKRNSKSQRLELADCLIAASAFVRQALLATANARHYPMSDVEKEIVAGTTRQRGVGS